MKTGDLIDLKMKGFYSMSTFHNDQVRTGRSMEEIILNELNGSAKRSRIAITAIDLNEKDFRELCENLGQDIQSDYVMFQGPLAVCRIGKL
jgi:hypothetical protein